MSGVEQDMIFLTVVAGVTIVFLLSDIIMQSGGNLYAVILCFNLFLLVVTTLKIAGGGNHR